MKVLFDTSVLVAAHIPSHVEYAAARFWLERATQHHFKFVISAHTLVETYSVLTRMPLKPRISPSTALQFLKTNVLRSATVVTLTTQDYLEVLNSLAESGISGGMTYDALLVKAAELHQVDLLLTFNQQHFERLWPDHITKIKAPSRIAPP